MRYPVTDYTTLVFDCDGVVLDSNKVKTAAFYQSTLPYGEAAAQAMVDYHIANGGVSRYKKFVHFLENIVPAYACQYGPDLEGLLYSYSGLVRDGLLKCDVAPGLLTLRRNTPLARWLIVSGGDQDELRYIFSRRGILDFFDGGVFGSPDTKEEILKREICSKNIIKPALYCGDSIYDYECASRAEVDFVFVSAWSEVAESDYSKLGRSVVVIKDLSMLSYC
jgi:phosphoglycolate phosphatase-like HAD superfamily hydrolase